jgi:biotin carboxylase
MTDTPKQTLGSIEDIKRYFAENDSLYYFISSTNFNLMGLHEWVKGWQNVNLIDCFDGGHPQVQMVPDDQTRVFKSMEDINEYLLENPNWLDKDCPKKRALFLFFNDHIEEMCRNLNLEVILPKNSLVKEIDSKIVTTEIGDQAGVPSVPNVLAKVSSYAELQRIADEGGLGSRLVVQTAYGDSGKTTFFIASKADYLKVAPKIESEEKVKVMRWVTCTGTAIEASATRWGTFVGPLLTELIGDEALTPYPGGWCGNELYAPAFSAQIRQQAQSKTEALGQALYQRGYRGHFEVDYLIDHDNGEVYLGELNARITGISAMTNMANFYARQIPLFLFHLLEYDQEVDLDLDVEAFNRLTMEEGAEGVAAQVILKYTDEALKVITKAPVSGVYKLDGDGQLSLHKAGYNRREALAENQAFILRIMMADEYAYKGGDLAIMFVNQVIGGSQGKLEAVGQKWVDALKRCFQFRDLTQKELSLLVDGYSMANTKSGPEQ